MKRHRNVTKLIKQLAGVRNGTTMSNKKYGLLPNYWLSPIQIIVSRRHLGGGGVGKQIIRLPPLNEDFPVWADDLVKVAQGRNGSKAVSKQPDYFQIILQKLAFSRVGSNQQPLRFNLLDLFVLRFLACTSKTITRKINEEVCPNIPCRHHQLLKWNNPSDRVQTGFPWCLIS